MQVFLEKAKNESWNFCALFIFAVCDSASVLVTASIYALISS